MDQRLIFSHIEESKVPIFCRMSAMPPGLMMPQLYVHPTAIHTAPYFLIPRAELDPRLPFVDQDQPITFANPTYLHTKRHSTSTVRYVMCGIARQLLNGESGLFAS